MRSKARCSKADRPHHPQPDRHSHLPALRLQAIAPSPKLPRSYQQKKNLGADRRGEARALDHVPGNKLLEGVRPPEVRCVVAAFCC